MSVRLDDYDRCFFVFFFFKQKTAYEMRISDWSSDVCSSDLRVVPRHVCEPTAVLPPPEAPPAHPVHHDHTEAERPGAPEPGAPTRPAAAAAHGEMAHEMGHGAGMDMQAMVRDMRNRFWIALIFTVPIFIYSPMGGMFTPPAPPFGGSEEHTSELQSLIRISYAV